MILIKICTELIIKHKFPQMSKVFLMESNTAIYFHVILELSVDVPRQCNDGYIFINLFPELFLSLPSAWPRVAAARSHK